MAITRSNSGSNTSSVAVASLSNSALINLDGGAGWVNVILVALGSTSSFVTSVTDTASNTYIFKAAKNATNVRFEIWVSTTTNGGTSKSETVNIGGGNTTVAFWSQQYNGVSSIGNLGTGRTGTTGTPYDSLVIQEAGNYIVGGAGFVCQSGDNVTSIVSLAPQKAVPAATAVGVLFFDNTSLNLKGTLMTLVGINNGGAAAREWASHAIELRASGNTTNTVKCFPDVAGFSSQTEADFRTVLGTFPSPVLLPNSGQLFP